jgi:hypothetical protein
LVSFNLVCKKGTFCGEVFWAILTASLKLKSAFSFEPQFSYPLAKANFAPGDSGLPLEFCKISQQLFLD